ncbi:hypothetical protein IU11_07435 [Cellulosimicrobium sp. MM]|nr:hypothetical protein IU11_07435 [Cellulosimicrobium sp. MM]
MPRVPQRPCRSRQEVRTGREHRGLRDDPRRLDDRRLRPATDHDGRAGRRPAHEPPPAESPAASPARMLVTSGLREHGERVQPHEARPERLVEPEQGCPHLRRRVVVRVPRLPGPREVGGLEGGAGARGVVGRGEDLVAGARDPEGCGEARRWWRGRHGGDRTEPRRPTARQVARLWTEPSRPDAGDGHGPRDGSVARTAGGTDRRRARVGESGACPRTLPQPPLPA